MTNAGEIKDEIATFLDRKARHLNNATILADLVPDSFLLVELHAHLEHKFGVEISSEEAASITTVGELVDRIRAGNDADN